METVKQHYIIDMSSNNNFVTVPAMQGDGAETRYVELELISNNAPYSIDASDTIITIMGTKPDGTEIFNPCELTQEGYILVEITQQMCMSVGRGNYNIILFSVSKNSQIKSFPFFVFVTAASFDLDRMMNSTDEFQILNNLMTQYSYYADQAKQSMLAAAESEANASTSEYDAASHADAAHQSELMAKASETNAANSAKRSESWAVGGTASRSGEDTDNAKYYSEQAAESLANINSGWVNFVVQNGHLYWEPVTP